MKYKLGTLEEYLIEHPPIEDLDGTVVIERKFENPKKDNEFLWGSDTGTLDENDKFNLVSAWSGSILKPKSIKYWVNAENNLCGVVYEGVCMASSFGSLEIFDTEEQFLNRCNELNIDVDGI